MKNKIILGLSALFPLTLASCNTGGIGKLTREVFNKTDAATAQSIYSNIKSSQFDNVDDRSGIKLKDNVKNGVITFKYKFKGNGTMRYFDLSLHQVDANVSAGFIISWDFDKDMIKAEGEDEVNYFLKGTDGKYYHCVDCNIDGVEGKYKKEIGSFASSLEFETYLAETIDYYSCFVFPGVFSYAAGVTGNYTPKLFPDIPVPLPEIEETLLPMKYSVSSLFLPETQSNIDKFNAEYKSKGYEIKTTYGSNDEKSVCCALSGKGRIEAVHGFTDEYGVGDFTVDLFGSYKNNFVNQFEISFKGNRHSTELDYKNYNVNYELNLLQDLKVGEYKPEEIDINSYTTITE